ncbi:hypothetical protein Bca4012_100967 [Brassica carinata]|uniref:Uncharacterized protein n=4 Tax=Brassica TaxID=3705 RepID=A0A8X7TV93_BRACI|nr:uncharacterized protein LOC111211359 [Brassica napus]KAG2253326.1 hypothetical protein Bca52824_083462 [Brassica carinata]CAF2062223.1 unnamed protein product [Brassica napus]VDD63437.1 unnamed protein product [Brassica oleracea]
MWMATRSSSGFGHEGSSLSSINFQTNTSSSEMGPYFGRSGGLLGMNMMSNNANSGLVQNGYSSNSSLDSVSGLKVDAPLASEWSTEEQLRLEVGLEKYKDKPSIMKYIKIAATLPDKTVRDVALRCRWMTRKRRKAEEQNCGKRFSYSKDKQVELTSSIPSVSPSSMASYPFLMPSTTSSDLSGNAFSLLDQNVRAFSQIRANLSSYKAHDNVDLFYQARNNLIRIQNDMNNMPGLMSQMPPLSVAIDDDLSAILFSNSTSAVPFNSMQNGGFHMKQEPFG